MRITQDGREDEIGELFENAAQLLAPRLATGTPDARVVVRLQIDGQEVPTEALGDLSAIPIGAADAVELETASLHEVALEGLDSAGDYAVKVKDAICHTAELMRTDRPEVANEQFVEVIDGMSVLFFALEAASRQLGELAAPVESIGSRVQPWLDEIASAHAAQDWIRVADYLEYEIAPILDEAPSAIERARRGSAVG